MVREGRIFISVATDPDFGANYDVTAYEVGAQVTGIYTGGAVPVRAGHGFVTGDKFIVAGEFPLTTKMRLVTGTTATTLSCSTVTVAAGDILINLAVDGETVAGTPNYDGNGLAIYTDMAYGSQAANNRVSCDANGRFRYFHKGIAIWELVRTSTGVPFAVFLDAGISAVTGPDSTTDNAVVRWDGATGEASQNSVVIVSDAGAVTGVTSLVMGGALSGVTTLSMGGTLSGVTALTIAGGLSGVTTLAMAGALTGVTTLNASGLAAFAAAATVGTTLTVTGVTTTTGGIAGGIPRNIGTWVQTLNTSGSPTTPATTSMYVGSIFVPMNMTITGIQFANSSAPNGSTHKVRLALYNQAGTLVASTAAGGTAPANVAQNVTRVALSTPYSAVGPGWYWIGLTFNTAVTTWAMFIPLNVDGGTGIVGGAITSLVFDTLPGTITPFTTSPGAAAIPIASIY